MCVSERRKLDVDQGHHTQGHLPGPEHGVTFEPLDGEYYVRTGSKLEGRRVQPARLRACGRRPVTADSAGAGGPTGRGAVTAA